MSLKNILYNNVTQEYHTFLSHKFLSKSLTNKKQLYTNTNKKLSNNLERPKECTQRPWTRYPLPRSDRHLAGIKKKIIGHNRAQQRPIRIKNYAPWRRYAPLTSWPSPAPTPSPIPTPTPIDPSSRLYLSVSFWR